MMLDWNEYQKQLSTTIAEIARTSPDIARGYRMLSDAAAKTGKIDAKTRELISLAVAVTLRCDGCITFHTDAAAKQGATKEEVIEALGIAISVNAGAALIYSARTVDAFAEKTTAALERD
jgi:AhpD family alkylhydroperoxidase